MNKSPQVEVTIDLTHLLPILLAGIPEFISAFRAEVANYREVSAEVEPLIDDRRADRLSRAIATSTDTAEISRLTAELHDAATLSDKHPARFAARTKKREALNHVFAAVQPILAAARTFGELTRREVEKAEAELFAEFGLNYNQPLLESSVIDHSPPGARLVPGSSRRSTYLLSFVVKFEHEIASIEAAVNRHATMQMPPILPGCLDIFLAPCAPIPVDPSDPAQSVRIRASQLGIEAEARARAFEARRPWRVAESAWRRTHPNQRPGPAQHAEWEWRCANVGKTPTAAQLAEWSKLGKSAATPAPTVETAEAAGPIGIGKETLV